MPSRSSGARRSVVEPIDLGQLTARICNRLAAGTLRDRHITLILAPVGNDGPAAFGSSLNYPALVVTGEVLVAAFRAQPLAPPADAQPACTGDELRAAGELVKGNLPDGMLYALIIGSGWDACYISNAAREGVVQEIEAELLPRWRKGMRDEIQRRADPLNWN
jgi:hypothetical protein